MKRQSSEALACAIAAKVADEITLILVKAAQTYCTKNPQDVSAVAGFVEEFLLTLDTASSERTSDGPS